MTLLTSWYDTFHYDTFHYDTFHYDTFHYDTFHYDSLYYDTFHYDDNATDAPPTQLSIGSKRDTIISRFILITEITDNR